MFDAEKEIQIAMASIKAAIARTYEQPVHRGLRATLTSASVQLEAAQKLAALTPVAQEAA